jgi:small subunit ribosomal protein S3
LGRKVHPYGYRLKIIRGWKSNWYAEGEAYAEMLHEDRAIRDLIREQLKRAGIANIEIERFSNQVQVTIWTAKPGIVIGRKGASVKELRQQLEDLTRKKVKVEVEEIKHPELHAPLIAENIVSQLERRISHGRAMKRAIQQTMRAGAEGVRIMTSGRLHGAEMARTEWQREGRVPLQTLRADIDYAQDEALTTFGRIGVKVWVYKGEILPEAEEAVAV